MTLPKQRLPDLLQLDAELLAHRRPPHVERLTQALARTNVREAQEVKRFRLALTPLTPILGRESTKLDQPRATRS